MDYHHVGVLQIVLSESAHSRTKHGFVVDRGRGSVPGQGKTLLDAGDQLVVVYVASGHEVDVGPDVVPVVVVLNHVSADGLHVPNVSQNGQSNLLLGEYSSVRYFNGGLQRHRLPGLNKLPVNGAPFVFDVLRPVEGVGEHISEDAEGLGQVFFECGHHVGGVLSGGVGVELGSDVLNLQFQTFPGTLLGALEVQMLQEVGNTAGLLGLVPASALYEYRHAEYFLLYLAIRESMCSVATVMPFLVLDRSGWGM